MEKINGNQLHDYIIAGASKVIQHEKQLNAINVFPVADGDTGSNLSYTMNHIISHAMKNPAVDITMNSILMAAMEASYGNSGTIIAGYFSGLNTKVAKKNTLSLSDFVGALDHGAHTAYSAISNPKEGTILTIMKEWGHYLQSNHQGENNLTSLIHNSIDYLKSILKETTNQLEELKDAGVVDAGAKGFLLFVEGIYDYLLTGHLPDTKKLSNAPIDNVLSHVDSHITYRYCLEYIIKDMDLSQAGLSNLLKDYGDSLIVQSNQDITKIHLHSDQPAKVANTLRKHGTITYNKADDMVLQYEMVHSPKSQIAIVTDSIADVGNGFALDHHVSVLPIQVFINDTVFLDKITIDSSTVFDILESENTYPNSSQPNIPYVEKTFKYLLSKYDHVIGIFVSSKLSGTFDKINNWVSHSNLDKNRIHLIDSKLNSGGQGLVVKKAVELVEAGLPINKVLARLKDQVESTHIYVKIPDLRYAARSGRVPMFVGHFANLIHLRPIISIDHEGNGIVLKRSNLIKTICKKVAPDKINQYSIVHTNNLKEAKKMAQKMTELTGKKPEYISPVSGVISAFIGQGAVGISYEEIN